MAGSGKATNTAIYSQQWPGPWTPNKPKSSLYKNQSQGFCASEAVRYIHRHTRSLSLPLTGKSNCLIDRLIQRWECSHSCAETRETNGQVNLYREIWRLPPDPPSTSRESSFRPLSPPTPPAVSSPLSLSSPPPPPSSRSLSLSPFFSYRFFAFRFFFRLSLSQILKKV